MAQEVKSVSRSLAEGIALLLALTILLGGCRSQQAVSKPSIEFTRIPLAEKGGGPELDTIEGRVTGARAEQQIVLYARSGAWYIQPFADQKFTKIQPDSKWRNLTHLGTEYAALLVEPDYQPSASTDVLPGEGNGVAAVALVKGEFKLLVPVFWQTWWFRLSGGLACLLALLAFYRFRLRQLNRQLNLRFEERLAERTRIAQELHDTLLQGFISANMQLHVAVDQLPHDSPAKPPLNRVLQLMGHVIEEGRNAVRGLRLSDSSADDLEQAFSRIRQELAIPEKAGEEIDFRVIATGRPRPLHLIIRDEVYRIGREALVNAFRHSGAKTIEVELEYGANHLRLIVRDDGRGIDPQVLRAGRDGHWGLSVMRERAERIGARIKVRGRAAIGTEVELSLPGRVAYQPLSSDRPPGWLARFYQRRPRAGRQSPERPGQEG